jgi:mannose-6-phosphate isomerase-like protein (cupin superfamily)
MQMTDTWPGVCPGVSTATMRPSPLSAWLMARGDTNLTVPPGAPESFARGDGARDRFLAFSNPATGEQIQFTAVPQGSGEDVVRFNWRSLPGGAITEHVHPHQEERFTIVVGEAHFTLDGEKHVVGAGETIVVPAGVRHSEANPGSVEIKGVVELRPGLRTKEMHEAFAGLAAEGKTTQRGAPKNPLRLGATLWHFRHESRVTSPPIWLQDIILPPLWALARIVGVQPYEDRWDSRIARPLSGSWSGATQRQPTN